MRQISIILVALLLLGGGASWLYWDEIAQLRTDSEQVENDVAPTPNPETYAVLVDEIDYHRKKLATQYRKAKNNAEREAVLVSTKNFLEITMPELMLCWLGTPWDYNGTASTPGDGKIACGYFVSTVMRDAGFEVQRIKLAQQPSQNILRTFLPRDQLQIKVGVDYEDYMQSVRNRQHGIYIIGLDQHVGFLVNNSKGLNFIHSGGVHSRVVTESRSEAKSIKDSRYRVIGNLTNNKDLIRRWLLRETFPTQS
ncbi:MAG: hypothetical protein QNL01_01005 [Akkermansiaceae bacterium]|jgi:hypothetical protein|tara:strand:- start:4706 stop:5464 length:759 start_codon:yes stop_codon:yes gene_type:complete